MGHGMLRRTTIIGAAVSVLLVASSGLPAVAAPIDDPKGDQKSERGAKTVNAPKGDIVRADGQKVGNDWVLRYTTAQPVDPRSDPEWGSDNTVTEFLLDTNGDEKADFNIEYGVDEAGLYAEAFADDGSPNPPTVCQAKPDFQGGTYTVTVAASCIKNPGSVRYRVETSIDTNTVTDDGSVVAEDRAPDFGYAQA